MEITSSFGIEASMYRNLGSLSAIDPITLRNELGSWQTLASKHSICCNAFDLTADTLLHSLILLHIRDRVTLRAHLPSRAR